MKFKRKIAGLLAALMVLTLGSTMVFADNYSSPSANDYNSPSADDYNVIREVIAPGMTYIATSTDAKTPWVEIEGENWSKNLDGAFTKGLTYKSKANANQAVDIMVNGAEISSVKISKSNMTLLASRDGNITIYGGSGVAENELFMNVQNGKALDFSVAIKNNDAVSSKLQACGYSKRTCQFTIGGSGKLNGPTVVRYNYTGNSIYGYLYFYNPVSDKLEYVSQAHMGADGQSFQTSWEQKITNAGKYVITEEKLPDTVTTGNVISSDNNNAVETINSNDTVKGSAVKITDASSDNKIGKSTFEVAKAKGVNLVVESPKNNATFKFSNFDKVNEMSGAFDPTVTIGKSVVKAIDSAMADSKVTYLTVSFAYDGKLPGKTDVTLDLSEGGFKDGATVYLYYFNEKTNAFELVDEAKYTEGFATFEMEHCSDYIVTAEKLGSTVTTPKATPASKNNASNSTKSAKSAKTSDTTPIIPLVVVMFAGIAAVVVAFYRKKRA